METQAYFRMKEQLLNNQQPYRVVGLEGIAAMGNNYFRIGNVATEVSPTVEQTIDRFIGVSKKLRKAINDTYGSSGITTFRNYLAQANSVTNPTSLAFIANPNAKIVDAAIPIKDEPITMEAFFDFLEMFMDKNSYSVETIEHSQNSIYGLTARLLPEHPEYRSFKGEDEFLSNGLYLKWNIGELEIGNYYLRLVCTNGQTRAFPNQLAHSYNLETVRIKELLSIPKKPEIINGNLSKLIEKAEEAMNTFTSLNEMKQAYNLLEKYNDVADNVHFNNIVPYESYLDQIPKQAMSSMNMTRTNLLFWDLFNVLTEYATHNQTWTPNDNRRTILMSDAMNLLMKKRDIINYYDLNTGTFSATLHQR